MMTDEEKLKVLMNFLPQNVHIGQINLGDGVQNNYYNTAQTATTAKPPIQEAEVVETAVAADGAAAATERTSESTVKAAESVDAEELSIFIHPRLDSQEGKEIERQIRNLVRNRDIPTICHYLNELSSQNKILLPLQPQKAYDELHRLGMPDGDTKGFTIKNFKNYYRK